MSKQYTLDEVLACFKILGHDIECGACMSIAFTGSNIYEHTCNSLEAKLKAWVDKYEVLSAESIYQMDDVQEGLYELGELVCESVGYAELKDDE